MKAKMKDVTDKNKKTMGQMKENVEFLEKIKKDLNSKARNKDLIKVMDDLKKYATNENLKELYVKVIPQLKAFELSMVEFEKSNSQASEMILRYDEVIAQKASKIQIIDVEKKCYEKFARRDDVMEQKQEHAERLDDQLA